MKLVSFGLPGREKPGVFTGDSIIDLCAVDPTLPSSIRGILDGGCLPAVTEIAARAAGLDGDSILPAGSVRLGPPICDPTKIICLGLNYRDHAEEH